MEFKPVVKDVIVRDLLNKKHPALAPIREKLGELWPEITGKRCEFVLLGVPAILGNLLRVVISSEIPVRGLDASAAKYDCSDAHVIPHFILAQRIPDIPLHQSCPADAVFALNAVNTSESERQEVRAKHLVQVRGKSGTYFNPRTIICVLTPGKHISIENITTSEDISSRIGRGNRRLAVNAAAVPLDPSGAPVDDFSGLGTADHWGSRISFNTNGTAEPREIIALACASLESHIAYLREALPQIQESPTGDGSEYTLVVTDSYPAIGWAITKVALLMYPEVDFVAPKYVVPNRELTIRMLSGIPAATILKNVFVVLTDVVAAVRAGFKGKI